MDMKEFNFEILLPIEKAEGEDGWFIRGIAAGPETDLENERLAPSALEGFVRQIGSNPVPFMNWHQRNSVTATLGEVTKAWLEPDFKMGVEIRLDEDHKDAEYIWKKINKGKQFGMSVAGKVFDYKDEYEKSTGRRVRTFYDVRLEEISLTTKPIYSPSFGTVLKKAADAANEGDNSMEVETPDAANTEAEEKPVNESVEAPASSEHVSEPETPAAEEKDVEKALSPKTKTDAKKIRQLVDMHRQMSTLIAELVLSEGEEVTPEATSVAPETVTAKSDTDEGGDLKKAQEEISDLREQVKNLKDRIPADVEPEVLVNKSQTEELDSMLKSMTPFERLRFGLEAGKR